MGGGVYTPPCEVVRVDCSDGDGVSLAFRVVSRGVEVDGCRVVFARPTRCMVTPLYTLVEFVRYVEVRVEEYQSNVVLRYDSGEGERFLVYPKHVWREASKYIEPLAEGRAPPNPGMLLYGPPGTGKTAFLELMASTLGLHVEYLEQSNVLSKWVGESEQRLAAALDRAEERQPSIVIADEGEWLLTGRSWTETGLSSIGQNLVAELLRRLQRWKNTKAAVLLAVATNYSLKAIDKAFLRAGRFGKPILVPLPDLEAVRLVFKFMGVYEKLGRERAELQARRLVAMGANMADVVEYARRIVKGEEPRLSVVRGHGYTRIVPIEVPEETELKELVRSAVRCHRCPDGAPSSKGRYRINAPMHVGVALAGFWLLVHGYTPILTYDSYRLEEAIHLAEISRGAIIVPVNLIGEHELRPLVDADCPVVLISQSQFQVFPTATVEVGDVRAVVELARMFYGLGGKVRHSKLVVPDVKDVEETIIASLKRIED